MRTRPPTDAALGRLLAACLVVALSTGACGGRGERSTGSGAPEGGASNDLPLLGSARGGHVWNTYCEGKDDAALLPVDPRSLVQPGVNEGKAAHFNAFWVDCHTGTDSGSQEPPKTCGEYRTHFERGRDLMEGGKLWFFGGDYTDAVITLSADQYNGLWARWGLASRPADFDERLAARWGVPLGTERNPYPLPGEDPNATEGGSGQLPVAITQIRDTSGRYTGRLGMNCNWCHSGKVGEAADGPGLGALYGGANSLVDIGAMFGDTFPGFPLAANKTRGTGDILLYPAIAALDYDRAGHFNASLVAAPSGGSVDFPIWWNAGHRTRRFHDGSFSMDDARPVMGFFMPILSATHLMDVANGRRWISERDEDVRLWTESLRAPVYPGSIDTELAEAGATLFHEKDLWGPGLDNPVPRPAGGNGSCATCHGVYSPRYANDTRYLDRPELEGIAAYRVPLDIVGTDPARAASLNDGLKQTLSYAWWSYGTNDAQGKCFGVPDPGGYLAPPLYGVWATAPYFHNGSVPSVWEVLKPSDRREIWRRWSAPAPGDDPTAFMSFDTDLARAYDHEHLGWNYEALECGDPATQPALDCTPSAPETSPAGNVWFSWNLGQPPLTTAALEDRKIYNTHAYSQGNGGHEFASVLTDDERRALIEYLKRL